MIKNKFVLVFLICSLSYLHSNLLKANSIDSLENVLQIKTGVEKLDFISDLGLQWKKLNNSRAEEIVRAGIDYSISLNDEYHRQILNKRLGAILAFQSRYEEGLCYLNESLDYFRKVNNPTEEAYIQLEIAAIYSGKRAFAQADEISLMIAEQAEENEDLEFLCDIHNFRGTNFLKQDKLDLAWASYNKALEIAVKQNNIGTLGYIYNNLGIISIEKLDYTSALDYYFQAIEKNSELHLQAIILNNISNVYHKLEDSETALEYQEKSLHIREEIGLALPIANGLNSIGLSHKNMLNYGKAMDAFRKSLNIKRELEGQNNIGLALNNIGIVHSRMASYDSAHFYYKEYLDLSTTLKDTIGIQRATYNIANTFFKQKDFTSSISLALEGLSLARMTKSVHYRKIFNQLLANSYEETNNFERSLFYKKKWDAISDSLLDLNKLRKVVSLEKENDIRNLQKEVLQKEAKIEAFKRDQLRESKINKYSIFLIGILVILAGLLYYFRRKKSEEQSKSEQAYNEKNYISDAKLESILKEYFEKLSTQITDQKKESNMKDDLIQTKITKMANFLTDKVKTQADWDDFISYFSVIHKDFFKDLKVSYPQITIQELNLCSLMKLNLLNNEIGQILGISSESVRKAQYRLSKKINVNSIDELRVLIHNS